MDIITEHRVVVAAEPAPERFDWVSIRLHWLTVALVAFQLVTAFLPHDQGSGRLLLTLHRSAGTLTLGVVLFRLGWRAWFADLPPLPRSMPSWQRGAARANEYALYALLALQPLTGLADGVFHGKPFMLFGLQVPALMAFDKPLFRLSGELHEFGAELLLATIAIHIGAALAHALVFRDGVMRRMLPARLSR